MDVTTGGLLDRSLVRPDGRVVAWTEYGEPEGTPLVRFPGTPGSRWPTRADLTPWRARALRVITTERPGFGASTPLPGRGFAEHADDVAALLDHLAIEKAHVVGFSGGAPHLLAFCARHPDRVNAASVVVGFAPIADAETTGVIPLNQQMLRLAAAGDREPLSRLFSPLGQAIVSDPLAQFREIMATAPESDLRVMSDPGWQTAFQRALVASLAAGVDGWVEEVLAIAQPWADIDLQAVQASITWYHGVGDRNCPFSAAQRLVGRLPKATLVAWPADAGHLYGYHHEEAILDELLGRSC